MNTGTMPSNKVHQGNNVKRLREILGVKQEAIAFELEMTQQAFSKLEQKELIDDEMLDKISSVLKVPVDAIKNMDDAAVHNYINTFNDTVTNHGNFIIPNQYNFNPIEKIVELYERMLEMEREKNTFLEEQLKSRK